MPEYFQKIVNKTINISKTKDLSSDPCISFELVVISKFIDTCTVYNCIVYTLKARYENNRLTENLRFMNKPTVCNVNVS